MSCYDCHLILEEIRETEELIAKGWNNGVSDPGYWYQLQKDLEELQDEFERHLEEDHGDDV